MTTPKWISGVVATVREKIGSADAQAITGLLDILKVELHKLSPLAAMPVDCVRWVKLEDIEANDWNPNAVAPHEMKLLHTSIAADGYTQPIVASYDEARGKYVVVDGFHRYTICRTCEDIRERTLGRVPVVVISKTENERMASTVRHNRARGKHSVNGMASLVFSMLDNHATDEEVCNELGLEPEELIRLKHVTGFSKLFSDAEYRASWETARQKKLRRQYERGEKLDGGTDADSDGEAVLEESA
jgi:hypothetical protein